MRHRTNIYKCRIKIKLDFFFASGPILLYSFDMDQYGHHFHGITSNDIINLSTNEVCFFFIIYLILLVGVYLYTWTWSLNDKIAKTRWLITIFTHALIHSYSNTQRSISNARWWTLTKEIYINCDMKMWSSFEIRVPTFNTLFIKMEFLTSGSKTSRTPTLGTEILSVIY